MLAVWDTKIVRKMSSTPNAFLIAFLMCSLKIFSGFGTLPRL
jgi:hypothetical protein